LIPTKRGFGTGAGRPRQYPSNAAKQKAYRERKKAEKLSSQQTPA